MERLEPPVEALFYTPRQIGSPQQAEPACELSCAKDPRQLQESQGIPFRLGDDLSGHLFIDRSGQRPFQ